MNVSWAQQERDNGRTKLPETQLLYFSLKPDIVLSETSIYAAVSISFSEPTLRTRRTGLGGGFVVGPLGPHTGRVQPHRLPGLHRVV